MKPTDTERCFLSFYRDLLEFAKENDDVVHEIAKRYAAYILKDLLAIFLIPYSKDTLWQCNFSEFFTFSIIMNYM